ncbi:uncharacterized protein LOC113357457 isoform X3 [Papaver somniferum]|uniref:uncharacterized protein LOC113357457 isoform X3 n=1 Tax=Papaver somniferum TaxID=3469 RepID=UPI000E7038BD|nr:uncharacterized protein LOC113357457 isoform X3 [Papaver somniferum]
MENLYSKLYDKYNKLKTRKDSEIDRYNHDQEVKFTGYMAAVEELVNCLRSENDRLVTKNQDLRNELASVRADRSDKEELCVQYEKLLTEETRKGKELSEEVEKLRNLQQEGLSCSARGRYNENGQMESPRGTYVESIHLSSVNNRKRLSTNEDTDSDSRGKLPVAIETERDSQSIQKESCCGKIISSGGSINANCVFHTLLEFLIGMKFEFVTKADGPCLSALHQSSGPVHSDIYFGTSFQVASYPAIF